MRSKKLKKSVNIQSGKTKPVIIVIPLILLFAVLFFLFKDRFPGSIGKEQDSIQTVSTLSPQEVLALGGTCFNQPLSDESGDVEAQKEGAGRIASPEKAEYDIQSIVLGRDGSNLVILWDFGRAILADSNHNIRFTINQHIQGQRDDARFEVNWTAAGKKWTGDYTAADGWDSSNSRFREGGRQTFSPNVSISNNSIIYQIPWNLIAPNNQVDGLSFLSFMFHKPTHTSYTDTIMPPLGKRSTVGHTSTFYCDKIL